MNKYIKLLLVVQLLVFGLCGKSQNLEETIPLPEKAISGKLSNGLRYIIHPNSLPAKKVEFRMVVNIGSIVENEKQKGMAHFIEHMAFNGSEKFPGDSIIQSLRLLGVKYGFGLNAFTGYDKTIYILPVPTDNPKNIDLGLEVIKEWMSAMTILPEEVKDEKGVVLQEIKDAHSIDDFYDLKLKDSKYADRLPLGSNKDINELTQAGLKDFYNCWYRPDLITIIAVGDLDAISLEKKIKTYFSSLKTRSGNEKRKHFSLPVKGDCLCKSISDTMLSKNNLEIILPVKESPVIRYKDLRQKLVNELFCSLINNRLRKDSIVDCSYSRSWYLSDIAHAVFTFPLAFEDDPYLKVERLTTLLSQIKEHGFVNKEVEKVKSNLLNYLSKENVNKFSASWCDDYVDLAVTKDRYVSNELKYKFYKEQIESIADEELRSQIDLFYNKKQRMLICYRFNSNKSEECSKKELLDHWKRGLKAKTDEYVYVEKKEETKEIKVRDLVVKKLKPAKIVEERYFQEIGVTEIKFENGVIVALKPTISEDKEVSISLFSKGGLSLAPLHLYPYLEGTAAYVDMGGVADINYDELLEIMCNKEINISTTIGDYFHGLYGSAFTGNIDDLLKLFYLKITAPGKNYKDYKDIIQSEIESFGKENLLLKRLNASSGRVLQRKISEFSGEIFKNRRSFSCVEELKKSSLDTVFDFYNKLFGNSEGKTIVITGNFDINEIKPAIAKYFGNLPSNRHKSLCKFLGQHYPKGVYKEEIIDKDIERTMVTYLIHGDCKYSLKTSLIFKMMRDIIQNRLIKKFREEKGMVYSPFVMANYKAYPKSMYHFQVEYSCDEENVDYLEKLLFKELDDIKKKGIQKEELQKITQSFIVTKREVLSEDNYSEWRKKLQEIYLECSSIEDFDRYDEIVKSITVEDITMAFKKFIDRENYVGFYIRNNKKL